MSASNAFETALLSLIYQNVGAANIGDAGGLRGSAAAGVLHIGLHTADPGEAGTQATSETAYTGYARLAVVRSVAGFTVAGNTVSNAALLTFGSCTAVPGTPLTHFSVGTDATLGGNLLFKGALGVAYQPAVGNAPTIAAGALTNVAD